MPGINLTLLEQEARILADSKTSTIGTYLLPADAVATGKKEEATHMDGRTALQKDDIVYVPTAADFDKFFIALQPNKRAGSERTPRKAYGIICSVTRGSDDIAIRVFESAFKRRVAMIKTAEDLEAEYPDGNIPDNGHNYSFSDQTKVDWGGKGIVDASKNANKLVSDKQGSVYDVLKQLAGYTLKVSDVRVVETWGFLRNGTMGKTTQKVFDLEIVAAPAAEPKKEGKKEE